MMPDRYIKFHLLVKKGRGLRRTTVSIESLIAELFALRLRHELASREGHGAVREWLQERHDEQNMSYVDSGLLKREMLLEIADKTLLRKLYRG
jgi:hypothetical protein